MSADISFHVEINGSEEELSEAVRVIHHYENTDESSEERSWDLEDIDVTIDEPDSADIEAMGPYGSYDLEEVDLFIELAKQVPDCRFSGSIGGFSGSESVRSQAEYKERHLVLKYKTIDESSATEEELDEFWDGDSWDRIKEFSVIDHSDENGLSSTKVELTIKDKNANNVDYLVNNDAASTSTKNRKAKALGVSVITEDEFVKKFGSPAIPLNSKGESIIGDTQNHSNNDISCDWIRDKLFVLTGFSDSTEAKYSDIIQRSGGIVKSSTVLKTNYLVYNSNYDHETVKLKRAKELAAQGKDIVILTEDEFVRKLGSLANCTDSKKNGAAKPTKKLMTGSIVGHPVFGRGVVTEVDGNNISVSFDNVGIKVLAKNIAPLKRLSPGEEYSANNEATQERGKQSDKKSTSDHTSTNIAEEHEVNRTECNWIRGKLFVLTGFSDSIEAKYSEIIQRSGGSVISAIVLKTNYLIYNPAYEHETVKLKRAKYLLEQGKDIVILTEEEFIKKLKSHENGLAFDDNNTAEQHALNRKEFVFPEIKRTDIAGHRFCTLLMNEEVDQQLKAYLESKHAEMSENITNPGVSLICGKNELTILRKANAFGLTKPIEATIYDIGDFISENRGLGTIVFGSYPAEKDGKDQPIKWNVIYQDNDKMLLLSAYGIDAQKYASMKKDSTWESSELRQWLNSDFYDRAFSEEEKVFIEETVLDNNLNTETENLIGKQTTDHVFLLSAVDAERYLSKSERQIQPTPYAFSRGAYVDDKTGNTWWWLRNPGHTLTQAVCVYSSGGIYSYGYDVNYAHCAICPAIWLKLPQPKQDNQGAAPTQSCQGKTFVITGKVNIFKNREAFKAYVKETGGKVSDNVNVNTDYLVNNDIKSDSTKNRTAKALGTSIITESEFIEMFGSPKA